MPDNRPIKPEGPSALDRLRTVWRDAERLPVAGSALRRFHNAENAALGELKQRLDALDTRPRPPAALHAEPAAHAPAEMLADLLARERSVDPDQARDDLYRRILGQLLPDEIAMLRVLASRGVAALCHIGGARLPAGGAISLMRIRNATALGQQAGVLLREYAPHYMSQLLALGLVRAAGEDSALAADYELLLADAHIRREMETIRHDLRLYPRVLRRSATLSPLGEALWRDCFAPAEAINAKRPAY